MNLLFLDVLTHQHTYLTFTVVLCIGLYMMIASEHLVKKIVGLNLFQTAIFLFFVATAYVSGGRIPIVSSSPPPGELYASPLPHVIVLTAIVVGVSLTAVGLALCIRIFDEYGTLRADELREVMKDEGTHPRSQPSERSVARDDGGEST